MSRSGPASEELMPDLPDEPPLVVRFVEDDEDLRAAPRPQPGIGLAALLTLLYWTALTGTMVVVIAVAVVGLLVFGPKGGLAIKPGADPGDVGNLPPALREAVAWSVPAGYFGGFVVSLVVLRVVVGRNWLHDIGLARLPVYHLLLGFLALPGFMIVSDAIAQFVQPIDALATRATGIGGVGDTSEALRVLYQDFHWSFAVFAIGIGPGLVEELWCRGFLGRGLIGRHGWFAGIALTSLFFGALHAWPPSYVIVTAVMGAGLHFAYVASRSLWVPIAMHTMNNSFAALAAVKAISTEQMEAALLAQPAPIVAAAACLLLVCGLAMRHSRWTWPGETPGQLIPPCESNLELSRERPHRLYTIASIGFCALLIGLVMT